MGKRLRNLKFLNQQVVSLMAGQYNQTTQSETMQTLCSITNCDKWSCEECPIHRESLKQEKPNG